MTMSSAITFLIIFAFIEQGVCQGVTQGGCECEVQWSLFSLTFEGCSNPDDDPNGEWCVVRSTNCTNGVPGPIENQGVQTDLYYDYCVERQSQEPPTNGHSTPSQPDTNQQQQQQSPQNLVSPTPVPTQDQNASPEDGSQDGTYIVEDTQSADSQSQECDLITAAGCECQEQWEYEDLTVVRCANLDDDPQGGWCKIKSIDECSGGEPSKNVGSVIEGYFDYCQSDCGEQQVEEAVVVSNGVEEYSWQGPCQMTRAGCDCIPQWTYDGNIDDIQFSYYGCAKTMDDDTLPWCPIASIASCSSEPQSTLLGGNFSHWDYCQPACAPPKQGSCTRTERGCDCLQFWEYDGKVQQGCTRPDVANGNTWCVIDPETCTGSEGPRGEIPQTGQLWDYCDQSCK